MISESQIADLEADLNQFAPAVRAERLARLVSLAQRNKGLVGPERDVANMHGHTFFGYNAYGHSPSSLAWQARRRGFKLMGKVDFDVLDGVDEFLDACELVGVRGSAGIETRVYVAEMADQEVNSPGEPGVCYHMGIGFTSSQVPEAAAGILADLQGRAAQRNRDVLARVNAYLDPVTVDYEADVLPLTPGGNATERHMVLAFIAAAERSVPKPRDFWASKLDTPLDQVAAAMRNQAGLRRLVRAKLMKRGGIGYVQPGPDTFATVEEFHQLIEACGALPCACWLDGESEGEQATEDLLAMWVRKGVVAQNVIPEYARRKPESLRKLVRIAQELALPLNVGTEMNSLGQKLIDDFRAPELAPLRKPFMDGAYFVYGHTVLQRTVGLGYQSEWARAVLPSRCERNGFYTRVGQGVPAGKAGAAMLRRLDPTMSPADILSRLGD